jgi:diamine N-acetyltransferase
MDMKMLVGQDIHLRALEPSDLSFLYSVENNESFWEVSNTVTPFSRHILQEYLENAHRDIYEVKQLRLVIAQKSDDGAIGLIDLFDFEPKHRRAGVGILIAAEAHRGNGYAQQALQLLCQHAQTHLNMHQLYANIAEGNQASVRVFEKQGFEHTGTKRDWIFADGKFKEEWFFQKIL